VAQMAEWLEAAVHPEKLFDILAQATTPDRDAYPLFIRSPIYGTRCSTVIAVDRKGQGQIIERRFNSDGHSSGETSLDFLWSSPKA